MTTRRPYSVQLHGTHGFSIAERAGASSTMDLE